MRKTLILFFVIFFSFCGYSQTKQNSSDHLTFKGVPITGTIENFITKMKSDGLILLSNKDGFALMKGEFAGFTDCTITITSITNKNIVYKTGVIFPSSKNWVSLSNNYYRIKEMLIEKYGDPTKEIESFDSYLKPKNDQDKMLAIKTNAFTYNTTWIMSNGEIQLHIRNSNEFGSNVILVYFDEINSEIQSNQAKKDL